MEHATYLGLIVGETWPEMAENNNPRDYSEKDYLKRFLVTSFSTGID